MKQSTSARLDQLRKARSLNDVLAVMRTITTEVRHSNTSVSLSASKVPSSADLEEITIDHAGGKAKSPRKVKVGSKIATTGKLGKLVSFKAPPMDVVLKHYTVIKDLHENASELEAAEALIKQTFSKAKNQKAALSALKALRGEVDASLQKAFTALDGIATKHLPEEMATLGDDLVSFMIDHLAPDSYDNITKEVYVSPGDKKEIMFSLYVAIANLENRSGFVFEEYYVILTGIIGAGGVIRYFMNALPEFKVPGKYPPGKEIHNTREMTTRLGILLAHNEIVSDLERLPLPLNTDRAKSAGFTNITGVTDAYVKDDALCVVLGKGKDSPKNINAVSIQVIPLLNKVTGNSRRTKGTVSYRPVKIKRGGNTVLQFILTPAVGDPSHTLNVARLQELQDLLGLTDHEVHVVKTILHGK